MQVAEYQGRWILRDGYHRAVELLARGVHHVPVLLRTVAALDDLFPPELRAQGLLPEAAWLGGRPPLLRDYLDPALSIELTLGRPPTAYMVQVAQVPWP